MISFERGREVLGWLHERVTVGQAEARYAEFDRDWESCLGCYCGWLDEFRGRMLAVMRPGDELWLYDTGPESWANLHGDKGMALVRNGRVIEIIREFMN